MKKEVFKIVCRGREFGTNGYFLRALYYIGLYAVRDYFWTTKVDTLKLAIAFGISKAFIGFNVQLDANHRAASKSHGSTTYLDSVLMPLEASTLGEK